MARQGETQARPARGRSEPFLEATFVLGGCAVQVWGWTRYLSTDPGVLMPVVGCLVGWLAADAISGLAHFLADNFGSPDTPLLGRTVISTFREHHSSPTRMLEHGLLERNGWNFLGASLIALPCALCSGPLAVLAPIGLSAGLILSVTNQIHAWAHCASPPQWVVLLQHAGFFLSPSLHREHHAPFEPGVQSQPGAKDVRELTRRLFFEHYCISSGIWDRVFSWMRRDVQGALGIPPNRSEQ